MAPEALPSPRSPYEWPPRRFRLLRVRLSGPEAQRGEKIEGEREGRRKGGRGGGRSSGPSPAPRRTFSGSAEILGSATRVDSAGPSGGSPSHAIQGGSHRESTDSNC